MKGERGLTGPNSVSHEESESGQEIHRVLPLLLLDLRVQGAESCVDEIEDSLSVIVCVYILEWIWENRKIVRRCVTIVDIHIKHVWASIIGLFGEVLSHLFGGD
jgi:hypothetical protein